MRDRLIKLILGNTLASFSICCVINSSLGCFSVTAANIAISNWFGISIGMAGMLVELILLFIATMKGEGIGWTSIINATYGSLLIDGFMLILPTNSPYLIIGLLLLPFAWALMGSAGLGDTGSNSLMNAILKNTRLNITVVRSIQEFILLTIGILGARSYVSLFTILLVFGLGPLLQIVYKWINFDPTTVEHIYLIKQHNTSTIIK